LFLNNVRQWSSLAVSGPAPVSSGLGRDLGKGPTRRAPMACVHSPNPLVRTTGARFPSLRRPPQAYSLRDLLYPFVNRSSQTSQHFSVVRYSLPISRSLNDLLFANYFIDVNEYRRSIRPTIQQMISEISMARLNASLYGTANSFCCSIHVV
jgi:hypothetical protein